MNIIDLDGIRDITHRGDAKVVEMIITIKYWHRLFSRNNHTISKGNATYLRIGSQDEVK